jgi:flagellar hook-length control protein FliK
MSAVRINADPVPVPPSAATPAPSRSAQEGPGSGFLGALKDAERELDAEDAGATASAPIARAATAPAAEESATDPEAGAQIAATPSLATDAAAAQPAVADVLEAAEPPLADADVLDAQGETEADGQIDEPPIARDTIAADPRLALREARTRAQDAEAQTGPESESTAAADAQATGSPAPARTEEDDREEPSERERAAVTDAGVALNPLATAPPASSARPVEPIAAESPDVAEEAPTIDPRAPRVAATGLARDAARGSESERTRGSDSTDAPSTATQRQPLLDAPQPVSSSGKQGDASRKESTETSAAVNALLARASAAPRALPDAPQAADPSAPSAGQSGDPTQPLSAAQLQPQLQNTVPAPEASPRVLPQLPVRNETQILEQARVLFDQRGGQVQISLEPPQLGGLELRVRLTEQAVQLDLVADRKPVADLIARHIPELSQALEARGITIERASVEFRERGFGEGSRRNPESAYADPQSNQGRSPRERGQQAAHQIAVRSLGVVDIHA